MTKLAIAKVGDKVSCPRCGENEIVEGAPGIMGDDGRALARKGDKTDCGAVIEEGISWFIVDGMPAAFIGAKTSHDGKILDETPNTIVLDVPDTSEQTTSPSSPDLKSTWRETQRIEKTMDIILAPEDPAVRNKAISAAYAKVYLDNPTQMWAGVAAFASKQVGCGIADSEQATSGPRLASLSNKVASIGSDEGNLAQTTYDSLAEGNEAVFRSTYPALALYQAQGMEGFENLEQIDDELAEEMRPMIDALILLDDGDIEGAATKIAEYEQYDVLQMGMYRDNPDLTRAMVLNQRFANNRVTQFFGAKPIELVFAASCEGDAETPRVPFEGKDLTDFNERWPYTENILEEFKNLFDTQDEYLTREIALISARGR